MPTSQHTVTLHVPAQQLPVLLTRLTTYLLHNQYTFLQTCHHTTHTDFDIFQQQRPLVRLTLRSADVSQPIPDMWVSELPPTLAAEAVAIIHHLRQATSPRAGSSAEQGA
jgi:hypothetical protein